VIIQNGNRTQVLVEPIWNPLGGTHLEAIVIVQIKDDGAMNQNQNVGCRDEKRIRQYFNSRIQQARFRGKELR